MGRLESRKPMAHKRPAEENASSTVCQTPGCNRVAFGSHRYCCSQCKHSNGIVHGHRCGFRQETFREPSPSKAAYVKWSAASKSESSCRVMPSWLTSRRTSKVVAGSPAIISLMIAIRPCLDIMYVHNFWRGFWNHSNIPVNSIVL